MDFSMIFDENQASGPADSQGDDGYMDDLDQISQADPLIMKAADVVGKIYRDTYEMSFDTINLRSDTREEVLDANDKLYKMIGYFTPAEVVGVLSELAIASATYASISNELANSIQEMNTRSHIFASALGLAKDDPELLDDLGLSSLTGTLKELEKNADLPICYSPEKALRHFNDNPEDLMKIMQMMTMLLASNPIFDKSVSTIARASVACAYNVMEAVSGDVRLQAEMIDLTGDDGGRVMRDKIDRASAESVQYIKDYDKKDGGKLDERGESS